LSDWHTPVSLRSRLRDTVGICRSGVRLAWRASPAATAAIVGVLALEAALRPFQLHLSRLVVDRAVSNEPLLGAAVLAAMALAASQLLSPLSSLAQSLAGDRLTAHVGEKLISAANRWTGLARFEDPAFQDDLHRARNRAATGSIDLVVYGSRAVLHLFEAAGLALVMVGLHPLAPLVIVAATLPSMATAYEFNNRVGSHLYSQTPEARRLEYSRNVLLTPEAAKDVRLFGLGPFFRRRYDSAFDATTGEAQRLRQGLAPRVVAASLLSMGVTVAVFLFVVRRVAAGQGGPGDVVLYGGAAAILQNRLGSLGFEVGFLPNVLPFVPALMRVMEAGSDLAVAEDPVPVPRPLVGGIVFEDVSFTYPGRDAPALDGVTLRIGAGECVALVGHNGAGKTTLIKLLLRLYDPTEGRISLDGTDLRLFDPTELRSRTSVIFQDFVRYELTAGENIGLGDLEALGDENRLLEAAARAGAASLVAALPEGLDTALGRQFGGRELSEGEWQKLALARSLLRDADLLVLDEPTAALDVETEYDLYCRFREITAGRTTVLISHRLSTVRMADRIVFLSGGRVQEEGTHDELLTAEGSYARLFRLQASQHLGTAG
jgi:ATP-binding cassette subfamily B protein